MVGDGHVDDPSTGVREDDEHEQESIRDGWDDDEIDGHDLADMVGQEGSPRLRWWRLSSRHVLRNGRLTHRDPQLLQFPMNPRRTPERIRGSHSMNQRADLRAAAGRPIRWRLFQVQNRRNPRRCHARTVAGCTMTSAGRHSRQIRENHTQRSRFAAVRRRRGRRERSKTCNWCRRARISSCIAARERISERSDRTTATTMGITVRRLFDGDKNLNESRVWALW